MTISKQNNIPDKPHHQAVIIRAAGLAFLIIIVIGVLNSVFIDGRLISNEDINLTINNIAANEFLFRFGSVCILILYVLVMLLAVLLYFILNSVNKNIALVAMVLRLGEALLGLITVLLNFIILGLINNQSNLQSLENGYLNLLIKTLFDARIAGLYIVLLLVGIGGTLFFYLFYKAYYIPKILSIWGIFTYLSMLVLSLAGFLLPDLPGMIEIILYGAGTLFELTIGFWLLLKGIKIK